MSATQMGLLPVHNQTSGCGSPCNKPLATTKEQWDTAAEAWDRWAPTLQQYLSSRRLLDEDFP